MAKQPRPDVEICRLTLGEKFKENKAALRILDDILREIGDEKSRIYSDPSTPIKQEAIETELSARIEKIMVAVERHKLDRVKHALTIERQLNRLDGYDREIASGIFDILTQYGQYSVKGGYLNVEGQIEGLQIQRLGMLRQRLLEKDLLQRLENREIERDVARALHGEMDKVTDRDALEIAAIFRDHNNQLLKDKQAAGMQVRELTGRIALQVTNRDKLIAGITDPTKEQVAEARQKWIEFVYPKLNLEKTFGTAPREMHGAILGEVFDDLRVRGRSLEEVREFLKFGREADKLTDISKRYEQKRGLHFKDGDSFYDYQEAYGAGGIYEAIAEDTRRSLRDAVLYDELGPDPKATVAQMFEYARNKYRDDDKVLSELKRAEERASYAMDALTGTLMERPGALANLLSAIRFSQTLSKLGGAVFSQAGGDTPAVAAYLAKAFQEDGTGPNLFSWMAKTTAEDIKNFALMPDGKQWQKRLAWVKEASTHSIVHGLIGNPTKVDSAVAGIEKAFAKVTLQKRWAEASRMSVSSMFSFHLADKAHLGFDELPSNLRTFLSAYDLSAKEWNMMRESLLDVDVENGGDKIFDVGVLREKFGSEAFSTERKIIGMMQDTADISSSQVGLRHAAILGRRDTGLGIALRAVTQFATVGLFNLDLQKRMIRMGHADTRGISAAAKGNIPYIMQFAVLATASAYAAQSLREAANSRTPPPLTVKNTLEMMGRAGLGGMFFDIIAARDQNFAGKLTGPLVGEFQSIAQILADDDMTPATRNKKLTEWMIRNTPGQNIFWLRPALDQWFIYAAMDSYFPGYARNKERQVKERGQDYLIDSMRPTEAANR
jgi:hypothetical protein